MNAYVYGMIGFPEGMTQADCERMEANAKPPTMWDVGRAGVCSQIIARCAHIAEEASFSQEQTLSFMVLTLLEIRDRDSKQRGAGS